MKEFSESDIHLYNAQVGGGDHWCEHEDCLDITVPFATKGKLEKHMKEVHGDSVVEPGPSPEPEPEQEYENVIKLDLSMRALLKNTDSVLIPIYEIYFEWGVPNRDTYDPGEEKFHEQLWVYHKMKKVLVSDLDDKKLYLTANLDAVESSGRWAIYDFLDGEINPILTQIEITTETLPNGKIVPQLEERIEGSITQHWYLAPKKEIYENVSRLGV
jgi:hypothetical protein